MKNKINKYFFQEFSHYFIVVLFALVSIVWIAQAVNFLDLVVEDGHAFTIYISYTLLNIPKILTKLIPFSFLTALILTLLKFEKDNELIVLWTSGLNKIKIVNLIFLISVVVTIIQLIMASTISPTSLNYSRSLLKNSNLDFLPSLIKEKEFIDTIQGVTFFVEKKSVDGSIENVFIRDDNTILKDQSQRSSTIFAKKGFIKQDKDSKYLILYNGIIQKESKDGKINFIKFDKTTLNMGALSTKSIIAPKIQETSSINLIKCILDNELISSLNIKKIFSLFYKKNEKNVGRVHNCERKNKSIIIELNRRFGMPFYIPILALIGSFLLSSRQEGKMSGVYKGIFFLLGFFVLVLAEISIRYSDKTFYTYLYYSIPFIIMPIVYLILIKTFKYENLN